ncbi:hypothetical protein GCM10007028_35130 [Algibacter mikhailovii]|uniref:Uncharacterized protein n=1 Tax=Algibacter mikhailovii TaxID=425498 RepID=A0A918RCZ0_9FLAO|nr:hypothetical protein GCM10007028_35130 [Algibacter mikhailovii]
MVRSVVIKYTKNRLGILHAILKVQLEPKAPLFINISPAFMSKIKAGQNEIITTESNVY